MSDPEVSIIVTSHNQLKYSKIMYASLKKYTHYPYELVWVDCVSTDGTREWLNSKEHEKTVKVFVPKMGIGEAMNMGFSKCNPESKYIGDLDNDLILTEAWLTKLLNHMEPDASIAMCGAMSDRAAHVVEWKDIPSFTPKNRNNLEEEVQAFSRQISKRKGIRIVPWCNGCHTLYRRLALEMIGLWDSRFWMGEDVDLGIRLTRAGWKCVVALDTWVYHFLSKTTAEIDKTDTEWHKHREESMRLVTKLYG